MAVPIKQPIQINFARGLDTKNDPFQVGPQNFLQLQNTVFQTRGRLTKRNGFAQDPTAVINPLSVNLSVVPANVGVGRLVTQYNQEKIICDGLNLFSLSDSDSSWIYKGRATLASLAQTNINKDVNSQTQQDSAQNNTLGWNLFAWVNTAASTVPGLFYNIIDQISGQVILPATLISANGIKPRCFSVGGNLYLVYYDTSLTQLRGLIINSLTTPSSSLVANDINTATPNYDLDVYNGSIYLAYETTTPNVKISLLSTSLVATASITKSESAVNCISIFNDPSNNVWVAYGNGSAIKAFVVNSTVTATVLAPTTVDSTATGQGCYNVTGTFSNTAGNTAEAYIFYDQPTVPTQNGTLLFSFVPDISPVGPPLVFNQPASGANTIGLPGPAAMGNFVGQNVFIFGGGVYTVVSQTPGYLFNVSSSSATTGATYTNNGNTFTVVDYIPSNTQPGTILLMTGASPPLASGTLTKASGTGDATIAFSASSTVTSVILKNTGDTGNAAPGTGINAYLNDGRYVIDVYQTLQSYWTNFNTLTVAGTAGTPELYANQAGLASKAWSYLGIPTVTIVHPDLLQPTYFVSNLYNYQNSPQFILGANLAVKICESEAGGIPAQNILPRVNQQSATAYQLALLQQDLLFTSTSITGFTLAGAVSKANTYSNFGVVSDVIDFSLSNPSNVVLGNNLHIASGVLLMYDGQNVVEHNFHIYPTSVTAVVSSTTGGQLSAGQYGYQAIYEWTDNQGQVHKSAPSPVASIAVSAGSVVNLSIPFLTLTQKPFTTLVIYRTQANGSIYFRLLPVPNTEPNQLNTNPSITSFNDGAADGTLTANEQIYTTGEVENIGPPACFALFAYKNRLILIPSDNPYSYLYSKQVPPGSPVEFSDLFVENVGTVYGPLTGGARLDDKFILGTATNLLYVVGDGPAASGANNDFSDPIFITSDAGLVNQQSFVYSPIGLFFKSQKGIYICGRDLSVEYKGAAVERFNSQAVVGGQLISNSNQVRFLLGGGGTLMYDYFYGEWGQFSNPSGIGDCIYNGLHTYITAGGGVFTESPGVYLDGATPVLMNFTTAWFKLAGLQGYQRSFFYFLLASYLSPHQLSVSTYTNFNTSPDQTNLITPNSNDFLENWRGFFKNQRCQSFAISVQEVYAGTPGAAFTMSGINLIAGVKSSFRTISAAQSVG